MMKIAAILAALGLPVVCLAQMTLSGTDRENT